MYFHLHETPRTAGSRGLGEGNGESVCNGHRVSVSGRWKVLQMDGGGSGTTLWMRSMPLNRTFKNGENSKFLLCIYYDGHKQTNKSELSSSSQHSEGASHHRICQLKGIFGGFFLGIQGRVKECLLAGASAPPIVTHEVRFPYVPIFPHSDSSGCRDFTHALWRDFPWSALLKNQGLASCLFMFPGKRDSKWNPTFHKKWNFDSPVILPSLTLL